MQPLIVRLVTAYGAGLWVGLVVLVPSRGVTVLLLTAALMLGARSRPGFAALLLGLGVGGATAHQEAGWCTRLWSGGPHAAIIAIQDRPSRRGLTTGTIAWTREGCGGDVALRFDSGVAVPGGSRVVAA